MPKSRVAYPPEFRQQIIDLVRSGRSPGSLAKEFEPSAQTIHTWVKQVDLDSGRRHDGLTTSERAEIRRLHRQIKQLRTERDILAKAAAWLAREIDSIANRAFEFVKAYQALYPVTTLCRVLGVSSSGYYAGRRRGPSARRPDDTRLQAHIEAIHAWSDGTYGTPRIWAQLRQEGVHVGAKRVARLLRQAGLQGVSRRPRAATTHRAKDRGPVPDLVDRDFSADGPDHLWVADITYVPTWAGFTYLAVVLDAFSRRVIGWAMAAHLGAELVLDALNRALAQRRPEDAIHHSDQGCQYTSIAFGQRCKAAGVRPSMGSAGDCFDNALCESFFATLECELIDRHTFRSQAQARIALSVLSRAGTTPIAATRP